MIECFDISKLLDEEGKPVRGYRKRMFREWIEWGMNESTEQRVCDQAMALRKNGWLSVTFLFYIYIHIYKYGSTQTYTKLKVYNHQAPKYSKGIWDWKKN